MSDATLSRRSTLDIPQIVIKRWPVVALGCLIAGLLAAVYWVVAPRIYESSVEILVMKKDPAITSVSEPTPSDGRSDVVEDVLATHIRLLSSQRVIAGAIKQAGLDELPGIRSHLTADVTVAEYIGDRLRVGRGGKGEAADAQVLHAEFRHTDADETKQVLTAIVASYERFLNDTFSDVGSQVFTMFERQHEQLAKQLADAQTAYAEFRKTGPMLVTGSNGLDIYENQLMLLTESKSKLLQERTALESRLDLLTNATDGPEAERFSDSDRLALVDPQHVDRLALLVDVERGDSISEAFQADQPARTEMAGVEFNRMVSLQLESDEIEAKFGSEHPRLSKLADSIAELQKIVDRKVTDKDFVDRQLNPSDLVKTYRSLLEHDLKHKNRQIEALDKSIEETSQLARDASKYEVQDRMLVAAMETKQQLHSSVGARLPELGMTSEFSGYSTEIIDPVSLAEVAWPHALQLGSLALALGLCAGIGGALYRELTDQSFNSAEQVSELLDAPVLGVISKLSASNRLRSEQLDGKLIAAHAPESLDAQTIRIIRTALMHSSHNKALGTALQFTSPTIGDGVSLVIANVAITLAATGKRVLLLDADLRRTELHTMFGLPQSAGLAEVLNDQADLPDAIKKTCIDQLELLSAGDATDHPAELLAMPRFEQLLSTLRERYDFILIDTPSVLSVSDALSVAQHSDGVVMVVSTKPDTIPAAQQAVGLLDRFDANLLGIVVNDREDRLPEGGLNFAHGHVSSRHRGQQPRSPRTTPATEANQSL